MLKEELHIWETTDDFFREKRFEVVEDMEDEETVVGCGYYRRSRTLRIERDMYQLVRTVRSQEVGECVNEISGLTETWRKNGKLHRNGGFPAHIASTQSSKEEMIDIEVEQYFFRGSVSGTCENL